MSTARTRPPSADLLMAVFQRLLRRFGPQDWWPGDSPLEVLVGAVLTQNAAWSNVEMALRGLKGSVGLSLGALLAMPEDALAERIRPCGYFRVKAHRLRNLLTAVNRIGLDSFLSLPTKRLRDELLAVSGVGHETADSILLYAAEKPVFVVDAYTRRALLRHHWISASASYADVQSIFMDRLPPDVQLYNEYHALWVVLGKSHCRPRPRCSNCPLEDLLPSTSP